MPAGLLCTCAMLVSVLPDWLAHRPPACLSACCSLLLSSLSFSEHPSPLSPFPLRSRQDHAGAVALLKLSQVAGPQLAGLPLLAEQMVQVYHSLPTGQQQEPLTGRSQGLVLEAVARVAACCHTQEQVAAAGLRVKATQEEG